MAEQEPLNRTIPDNDLPLELQTAFEHSGPGCVAMETNIGVVHICYAADQDIEGFANKPVWCRWELVLLPTAPVLKLNLIILDHPQHPYRYESFLNIGDEDQARVLETLLSQEELYLAFYGEDFTQRFIKVIPQEAIQKDQLQELALQAMAHWQTIPTDQRDFNLAKSEFQRHFPL